MTTDDNNNSQTNTNTDTSSVNEVPVWNGVDPLNKPSTADIGQSASVSPVSGNDSGNVSAYMQGAVEQTVVPVQDAVYNPSPDESANASVVVSGNGNKKTPVWFYGLFLIVLAVFIMITYLLYQNFGRSKQTTPAKLPEKISATPNAPTPTAIPTIFRVEVDPELTKLTKLNPGDEIADLESDTGNTNLNSLTDLLPDLDNKFNFTP